MILVEGISDVLALPPETTPWLALGAGFQPEELPSGIVLCFDGDRAGQEMQRRASKALLKGRKTHYWAKLPKDKDPMDCPVEQVRSVINAARMVTTRNWRELHA